MADQSNIRRCALDYVQELVTMGQAIAADIDFIMTCSDRQLTKKVKELIAE